MYPLFLVRVRQGTLKRGRGSWIVSRGLFQVGGKTATPDTATPDTATPDNRDARTATPEPRRQNRDARAGTPGPARQNLDASAGTPEPARQNRDASAGTPEPARQNRDARTGTPEQAGRKHGASPASPVFRLLRMLGPLWLFRFPWALLGSPGVSGVSGMLSFSGFFVRPVPAARPSRPAR